VNPVEAVVAIAAEHGIRATTPVVLRDTNNVVVWLRPHPVVAKVGTNKRRLENELRIAEHLVAMGAPVVGPTDLLPRAVLIDEGHDATFWVFHPQQPGTEPGAEDVANALRSLHLALARLPEPVAAGLPPFEAALDSLPVLLNDAAALNVLSAEDRALLARAHDMLRSELEQRSLTRERIHGSPHRLNVLVVDRRTRFIDFETTCLGPIEWDLAHLEPAVAAAHREPFDPETLRICRRLASVATATWCLNEHERGDLRSHGEYHLALVRRFMGLDR
jgi:Ser/Thr protein kinase RdoA (MazF antagonist)